MGTTNFDTVDTSEGYKVGGVEVIDENGTVVQDQLPDSSVQYAEVTVSSAEILALNATPKTLVAAPGAGKVLEFISATAILDYNSAAYAGVGATEDLVIRFTGTSGAIVSTTLETTGFIDQTSDQIRTHKAITTDLVPVANSPLVLHLLNGEVTTGNSPIRYKVAYRIHTTGL